MALAATDDAFATAQLRHAQLAAQAVEHDSNLLLRGKPPARLATDISHGGLTRSFLSSWHGTFLGRALALGKVSLNSEPICLRVLLTGYTEDAPLLGTLGHMAPEQLVGERSATNATTDVYGLGGILCFLITRRPPRHGVSDIADWRTTPSIEDRRALFEIPPELCRIAERALSPAQADRFQSADELKSEMGAFMAGGGWFETRHYLAGDIIIREGDTGSEAFIISSGVCDVFKRDPDGDRQFIRSLGPGDTFGELSVLTRKPRSATVVAQTDVSLRLVTPGALDRELKRNPVLASFMSAVTNRFCDLEARLGADSFSS